MFLCSLQSGSSGNAVFVSNNSTRLLIDAGLSGKSAEQSLFSVGEDAAKLSAILVTHEHIDHIRAVGVLSRRYNLPVYATKGTWDGMSACKINENNRHVIQAGVPLCIKDIEIKPFNISHDALEPVGYTFISGDKKVAVATDMGVMTDDVLSSLIGCESVLLEANHDLKMLMNGSYPYYLKMRIKGEKGHLSNEDCANACISLAKSGVKKILLGHLSHENNLPRLAKDAVVSALRDIGALKDIRVNTAARFASTTI